MNLVLLFGARHKMKLLTLSAAVLCIFLILATVLNLVDGFCCNKRRLRGSRQPVCASCEATRHHCCDRGGSTCNAFCCNCDSSRGGCIKGRCFTPEDRYFMGRDWRGRRRDEGDGDGDTYPFEVFLDADSDENGRISEREYITYMVANIRRDVSRRQLHREFRDLDRHGKGYLTLEDIDYDAAYLARNAK